MMGRLEGIVTEDSMTLALLDDLVELESNLCKVEICRVVVQAAESKQLLHRLGADWLLPHTYTFKHSTLEFL